jgi:hypothetical protein
VNHALAPAALAFEEIILRPPFPAIVALLLALGIVSVGVRIARLLRGPVDVLGVATGFFLAISGLLACLEAGSWAGLARLSLLRAVGIALAAFGVLTLPGHAVAGWKLVVSFRTAVWARLSNIQKCVGAVAAFAAAALCAAAIGPITDSDSIAYHMVVPLEWIRHGASGPVGSLLQARLVGLGENLNLLGMACGTDCLNAVIQGVSLLLLLAVIGSRARSLERGLTAVAVVVSIPVWAFLVPNQKPQLLPIAGNVVAFALVLEAWGERSSRRIHLAMVPLMLAAACRTSFLLTSGPLLGFAVAAAARSGALRRALLWGFSAGSILVLPVLAQKLLFYGDPLSPFLEPLRGARADTAVLAFSGMLGEYTRAHGLAENARWFFSLFAPTSLGMLSTTLGPVTGILVLRALISSRRDPAVPVFCVAVAALVYFLSQPTAGFLVEPILWLALFDVGRRADVERPRRELAMHVLAGAQGLVAGGAALLLAAWSVRAALTVRGRHEMMLKMTSGYEESLWINKTLPAGATVLSFSRFQLFLRPPVVFGESLYRSPVQDQVRGLTELARERGSVWFVTDPWILTVLGHNGLRGFRRVASRAIPWATRNPWNRSGGYSLEIVEIAGERP